MTYNKQKLMYISITASAIVMIILMIFFSCSDFSPVGKVAGKIRTSDMSVAINNQLIPAYDLKSGVYIVAEDLQLFGFKVEKTKLSLKIISPENSNINREYIVNLADIEENETAFYPQKQVMLDNTQISSYATKEYTLIPVSILGSLGSCSKESNSTMLKCDLYK